jgi:mRNA interferase HigB
VWYRTAVTLSFAHAKGRNYRQLPAWRGRVRGRRLPISSALRDKPFPSLHVSGKTRFFGTGVPAQRLLGFDYARWQRWIWAADTVGENTKLRLLLNTGDVKRSYTWASILSSDRAVFNILTNGFRLVTAVDFEKGIVWIKGIGTHKEYDKIDVKKLKHARH